jgi:uncharacterized protein (UPF0332 family)
MIENVTVYLDKAFDCLTDAEVLIEKDRLTASVSRSYYAMFHAAQAALLSEDIEAFTHIGVNIQFQKAFVKTGKFHVYFGKTFSKILDQRLKSDYEIGFKASPDDARHTFEEATNFVKEIQQFLSRASDNSAFPEHG